MKLYDIANDYQGFLDSDLTGDELMDCLDQIKGEFDIKAGNIMAVNETMTEKVNSIDSQIKRLQARKKTIQNTQERLKEYLRSNMERLGFEKISCDFFTVTLGEPVQKVQVNDVNLLPDEFVTVKSEVKPDLNAIKKALKDGEVAGAVLVDGKSRLLIK